MSILIDEAIRSERPAEEGADSKDENEK
jgi:hypothetical protein